MLRSALEDADLLAAEGEEDPSRGLAERVDRLVHIGDDRPAVAGDLGPGRPPQGEQRDPGGPRGEDRIRRDGHGIGVRRIDEASDPLRLKIGGKSRRAAEAADTDRNPVLDHVQGAAAERDGRRDIRPSGEAVRQEPRLSGAAEDENTVRHGLS